MTPVIVNGSSMEPTLKDNQLLILKKYDKKYERYDIVVFNYDKEKLIKRVIGLPGEYVEYKDSTLYIDGKKVNDEFARNTNDFILEELGNIIIPEGKYLVMGDNRYNSSDSRSIGLIDSKDLLGTTNFRLFPFNSFGKIEK